MVLREVGAELDVGADDSSGASGQDQSGCGGDFMVAVAKDGDRLVGSISDTGIGIPPEAMARLFSEFFRADNAKAISRMGTGLGLSIVKEIIERSGGKITAESELNKGTVFRFWLPVIR